MKLDQKNFKEIFDGFFIRDCVVRQKNILYFVLEEDVKKKPRTRVVAGIDMPGVKPWGKTGLTGMQRLLAGVSYQPKAQFVGISLNDHIYVLGSGEDGLEDDLKGGRNPEGQMVGMRGGAHKLRTIDGSLWLAGSGRTVGRRIGVNQWIWHDSIKYKSLIENGGFEDIDGFSSGDIYAVGGHGDIWHFDGKNWEQIAFPSNMDIWNVCCAGDGQVYVGAEQGTVFKGRGNEWKMISRGDMALPFRDMVWYQGKVWCTSDYGLWVVENGKVTEADVPDSVRACSGHLSVGDGVMLLAGMYGAALYDGMDWKMIIDYGDLD